MFPTNFDIVTILATLVALVVGISVHEFSHAWSANALGDPTAKQVGRITLNPVAHFDPMGFMMLVLMSIGFFGIAWGRPVPINPYRIRYGRRGMALSSLAGPFSNVFVAALFAIPLRLYLDGTINVPDGIATLLVALVIYNVLLAVFNIIPIPPLDGFHILEGILPKQWLPAIRPLEQYGMFILLALVFIGPLTGFSILSWIIVPPRDFLLNLLLGGGF